MSKLRIPFTPFQLGMSLMVGAGLIFCVGGDLFLLMFDRGTVSRALVMTNLVLSLLTMAVCGTLIMRVGEIDLFDEQESGDRLPAIIALRTYFCMIALDITGVLILMLAGALVWHGAKLAILVYAPLMFMVSGGLYYWRTSQMGGQETAEKTVTVEEQADKDNNEAAAEELYAADRDKE